MSHGKLYDAYEVELQTRAIERLLNKGYTHRSVVEAVTSGDLTKLETEESPSAKPTPVHVYPPGARGA